MIKNFLSVANNMTHKMLRIYEMKFRHEIADLVLLFRSSLSDNKPSLPTAVTMNIQLQSSEGLFTLNLKCFRRRV